VSSSPPPLFFRSPTRPERLVQPCPNRAPPTSSLPSQRWPLRPTKLANALVASRRCRTSQAPLDLLTASPFASSPEFGPPPFPSPATAPATLAHPTTCTGCADECTFGRDRNHPKWWPVAQSRASPAYCRRGELAGVLPPRRARRSELRRQRQRSTCGARPVRLTSGSRSWFDRVDSGQRGALFTPRH
jgi:hypothetical protein